MVRTRIALLIPAFALVGAPPVLAVGLPGAHNAPLPSSGIHQRIHRFGTLLEPRYVVGARALDQ